MTSMSTYTVYKLARAGQIPCVRLGRTVRFDRQVIDKWLDRNSKDAA